MSKYFYLLLFFFCSISIFGQQEISKKVKSNANYVEVRTDGIDYLIIEESDSDELEMTITDRDGLGVLDDFSCTDSRCLLRIRTELKIDHPNTNKINMLPQNPPSNVSAVVKIPKKRKVTILGDEIDIQTQGYEGVLFILIEKGNVKINKLKGITQVDLSSGTVYANVDQNYLDIRTRKGSILMNDSIQKSPLKKKRKQANKLTIKSVNANVVLTGQ